MQDSTKNVVDVFLTVAGMIGAVVAFRQTIREWRESQRWKRAEQLDKFVQAFESDDLLRLAALTIDWTSRPTTFKGRDLTIVNKDVLLALRNHEELKSGDGF